MQHYETFVDILVLGFMLTTKTTFVLQTEQCRVEWWGNGVISWFVQQGAL